MPQCTRESLWSELKAVSQQHRSGSRRKANVGRLLASAHYPERKGVVVEETEKYLFQEVVSPLRRLASCAPLDLLPQPTLYMWPLNRSTRLALEYRDSWHQREATVSTQTRSVDFALKALDSNASLTVEADNNLHRSLTKFAGDSVLSPLQMVFRKVDLLPWDISDVLSDLAQQDLDGRRRAVGILREERLLSVGRVLTAVGWVGSKSSRWRSS
eukprot:CAMPEP_0118943000 /NCGR_PEP_ID=MMETSP1169-20130426/37316_1 /TAXON_ID=36882 /ORGANISM="Pyramimonas obovata, Strain CCMP722" /LENGTH=213 /DNA_ID=CAMNT_0006888141 /DNA_START=311 /DNA_END=948 /DNA_ORIENTATION=-